MINKLGKILISTFTIYIFQLFLIYSCSSNSVGSLKKSKAPKGYKEISIDSEQEYFIDEAEKKCASYGMRLPTVIELTKILEPLPPKERSDENKCYWTNEILEIDSDYYKTVCPRYIYKYPIAGRFSSGIYNSSSDVYQYKQKVICYSSGTDDFKTVNYLKGKTRVETKKFFVIKNKTKIFSSDSQNSNIMHYMNHGEWGFIRATRSKETIDGRTGFWAYIGRRNKKELWVFNPEVSEIDPLSETERKKFDLETLQRNTRESINECLKKPNCDY